jgi:hypothetical protein
MTSQHSKISFNNHEGDHLKQLKSQMHKKDATQLKTVKEREDSLGFEESSSVSKPS